MNCSRCFRDRQIYAKGLCHSCYVMMQFKKSPNRKVVARAYYEKRKEWYKNYFKVYYEKNKEKLKAYQKEYNAKKGCF